MVSVGKYNTLKVVKKVDFGMYLDGGDGEEILLPKRYVPRDLKQGDEIEVFIYHDSDNRLVATTLKPHGILGDIVSMRVVHTNKQGAFMDWGLMKDIFVPLSQQVSRMAEGQNYLVRIYLDEMTGRLAATEKINSYLDNEDIDLQEMDEVDLLVQRETELGYAVIINNQYLGLLHFSDVFKEIETGDKLKGYIKTIRDDNKIDVMLGKPGYQKVADEEGRILQLLEENDGYLPYHDKSEPEEIYDFFGMSKKVFKMTIGALYKQKKIDLTKTGIKLI